MIDIRHHQDIIEAINAAINSHGIAEVKLEQHTDTPQLVVVEQKRYVIIIKPVDVRTPRKEK